jgi:hypothetical protein
MKDPQCPYKERAEDKSEVINEFVSVSSFYRPPLKGYGQNAHGEYQYPCKSRNRRKFIKRLFRQKEYGQPGYYQMQNPNDCCHFHNEFPFLPYYSTGDLEIFTNFSKSLMD